MTELQASTTTAPVERESPTSRSGAWRRLLPALGLVLLVALAYANAVFHPFLYDDITIVLENPELRSIENIPRMVGFTDDGFLVKTRWTRQVLYALQFAIAGPEPALFHATNIGLHAIVVLLLFALVGGVAGDRWVGWWAAALFAVHPVHTEVVSQVSGARELLATIFGLGAMLLLRDFTRARRYSSLAGAVVALYLAASSKEVGVMVAAGFVLLDLFEAARENPGRTLAAAIVERIRQRFVLYGGLAVYSIALAGALLFLSTSRVGLEGSPGYYDTTAGGLGALARASLLGLGLRLLIVPLGLTIDYSYDALGLVAASWPAMRFVDVAVLAVACALAAWGVWKRNFAGLAGAWFAWFYIPTAGVIPWHEVFAERFLYVPSIGLFAAVAAAGVAVARRPGSLRPALAAGTLGVALLAVGTGMRNEDWSSDLRLWESAVERYPGAARAQKALGNAYLAERKPAKALEHFREAVRILPNFVDAHVGVAVAETALMRIRPAMAEVDSILERWPESVRALNLKGYLHQTLGEMDQARAAYQRTVEIDPSFADGYNNLAMLYALEGDVGKTVEMYEAALARDPALVVALKNLAIVYREAYKDEATAAAYERRALLAEEARR